MLIVGGGIVGLATALALTERYPHLRVLLCEKEDRWAAHQTGRNSGVIHAGIYYRPGSLKATMARAGSRSMVAFCQAHGIAHDLCGKLIVATTPAELPRLHALLERAQANGLPARLVDPAEIREREPYVQAVAAIFSPTTGIVDYRLVAERMAQLLAERGVELRLQTRVEQISEHARGVRVETNAGAFEADHLINCAGLHSDRVARMAGLHTGMRIIPFRGEYYELVPERRHLVRGLIYPVPNPAFPFLGVHFTRMIDGSVHAGPNAVLALKREGYHKLAFNLRDSAEVLSYPAFWHLARKYLGEGSKEMLRSASKTLFVRSMQRLIPSIRAQDVVPTHAGVRAQALMADGQLQDDFVIIHSTRSTHVCNAPSPAATAALEIGAAIVERLPPLGQGLETRK
ncbi:L-2-hydroxyglutarate oxidase [Candidatus Viridilinea mediisalina]|nr:L-2-hydroxyglutarate oxidase [Candidatus Viridilinea mediisalina]